MKKLSKAIIAVLLVIVCSITFISCSGKKICEECGNEYSGKSYKITYYGEQEIVCRDCHDDFVSMFGTDGQ